MDSQWLKTQFALNPAKSKADLAKELGLEPSAVSKILGGYRQIKAQEYLIMRRFFGLPVDGESVVWNHAKSSYAIQPLGEADEPLDGAEWILPASILSQRTNAPPEKIKIFQVRENAMEPDFKHGEYVLIDLSDQKPTPPGVFIVSDGFGHMIRHCAFIPRANPPTVRISANSENFHSQTLALSDFIVIGRVIAKLLMV